MKTKTFQTVVKAIAHAIHNDKSTEWMIEYVQQLAALDYNTAHDQVVGYFSDENEKLCIAVDAMVEKMQKKSG